MKKILFAALAATMLFASCAKESGENTISEGENTKMGLSFSFPGMTRAIDDANATANEKIVTDMVVFIFDENGDEVDGNGDLLTLDMFVQTEDNVYTLKEENKIETTTGVRRIYVGMNLPTDMKDFTTEAELTTTAMDVDMSDLALASTGMAMFSTAVVEQILVVDETQNTIEVTVERMVAKVAASYKNGLSASTVITVGDVDFQIEKYGIAQDGAEMYPAKQFNGTKLLTPGVRNGASSLSAINANGLATTADTFTSFYAGENASPGNIREEVAMAVFQATFVPKKLATVNIGTGDIDLTTNGTLTARTLWVVTSDEGVYYCEDETIANAVGAKRTNASYQEYPGGYCYYIIFLNRSVAGKKCELHRNDFIHLEIAGLTGLGTPGTGTGGEEPQIPPVEPKLPVDEEVTNLLVNVTVKEWNYGLVANQILE